MPLPRARSRALWPAVALLLGAAVVTAVNASVSAEATNVLYLLVNGGAAALALTGALRRTGPERRAALLVGSALAASALGDLVYAWDAARRVVPDASPADVGYLLAVLLLIAALVATIVQGHDRRVEVDALIDGVTVVVVAVIVLWDLQARLVPADDGVSVLGRAVLTAYPALDAVLLGLLVRVVFDLRRGVAGTAWLAAGLSCWITADVLVLLEVLPDIDDRWVNLGWMVGGIAMSLAPWTPTPPDPPAAPPPPATTSRVLVAIVPLAVPTVLLLLPRDPAGASFVAVLLATLALFVLALVRTARLLRSEARIRGELVEARDQALAASRAKSEFLATMSHEVRTPMNGVLGLTELILAGDLDDRQRRYAEGVAGAGQALLAIINDILDFSKIEAGRVELEEVELDPRRLLDEVAGIVVDPMRSDAVRLRVTCDVPRLVGDPWRLRQVLLNLTSNAVKFTPAGDVVVSATVEAEQDDRVDVRFEVTDSGIGIDPGDLDRIFEPFAQADASTTREFGGTGLGLTISHRLVAAMGGTLSADSAPGRGSRFWFTLPLRRAPGRRVLLVEDGEVNRLVAEGILAHLGYDVVPDADPAQVDLVVLDAGRLAGLELAGTPAVVLATDPTDAVRAAALAGGAAGVVGKPIQPDELAAALAAASGASRLPAGTVPATPG